MDLDAIFSNLNPENIDSIAAIAEIDALCENRDSNTVLIRAFVGGWNPQQAQPFDDALEKLALKYKPLGKTIIYEWLNNDSVRTKLRWTCTELFTWLLGSDIHFLPTHVHQGMISKGGTDSWNVSNILFNISRMRCHLGVPMGKHIDCPIFLQSKERLYDILQSINLCIPTESVRIDSPDGLISLEDERKIEEFVKKIEEDPRYSMHRNDGKFVVKLSHCTGKEHRKYVTGGVEGIRTALLQFMKNVRVFGYYITAIIQPRVRDHTEAKVICYQGKAQFMNPHDRKRTSPFRHLPEAAFKEFADMVIRRIREVAPHVISDHVLRVDIFGVRDEVDVLHLFVNEVEGYEASVWGKGSLAGTLIGKMVGVLRQSWFDIGDTLIESHFDRIRSRSTT